MIFAPDDFAGDPYGGGNNQGMHCIFGAALVGVSSMLIPMVLAIFAAGFGIIAWEWIQLRYQGATKHDYTADLLAWLSGVGGWAALISGGYVSGIGVLAPVGPLFVWSIAYARRKWLN
jgi:hypothetical protein